MQVDKIKNIFSSDNIDESKYSKEKHEIFQKNIYNPLLEVLIFIYRGIFMIISFMTFLFAVIFHLRRNTISMKKRLKNLEEKVELLENKKLEEA